jgi:hypothetical protein
LMYKNPDWQSAVIAVNSVQQHVTCIISQLSLRLYPLISLIMHATLMLGPILTLMTLE